MSAAAARVLEEALDATVNDALSAPDPLYCLVQLLQQRLDSRPTADAAAPQSGSGGTGAAAGSSGDGSCPATAADAAEAGDLDALQREGERSTAALVEQAKKPRRRTAPPSTEQSAQHTTTLPPPQHTPQHTPVHTPQRTSYHAPRNATRRTPRRAQQHWPPQRTLTLSRRLCRAAAAQHNAAHTAQHSRALGTYPRGRTGRLPHSTT